MSGVVFFFENNDRDVFSGRTVDLDAWRYAIKAGGIDKAVCVNLSGADLFFDAAFDFTEINSVVDYKSWLNDRINENIVFLETEWSIPDNKTKLSLRELDHSSIDWYVFGSAAGHSFTLDKSFVYLPQDGIGALHSVHIASAVLLRRWEELGV